MPQRSKCSALLCLVTLLLAVQPAQSRGLYKWVDAAGVTHYSQHRPDDKNASSAMVDEWVSDMLGQDYEYPIAAPNLRNTLYLPMDKDWLTEQSASPENTVPGQVEVTVEQVAFKVQISVLPDRQVTTLPSKADLQTRVRDAVMSNPVLRSDFEAQSPQLQYSSNASTAAVWFTLSDPRYQHSAPPEGEYRYITQGTLTAQGMIATITILGNSVDSPEYRDALKMIKSARAEPSEYDRLVGAYKAVRAVEQESYARELISKSSDKQPETQFLFATLLRNSQDHEYWIELMQRATGGTYRPALNALISHEMKQTKTSE